MMRCLTGNALTWVLPLVAVGCGAGTDPLMETVGTQTSALAVEFSPSTPSVLPIAGPNEPSVSQTHQVALRLGYGNDSGAVLNYGRAASNDNIVFWNVSRERYGFAGALISSSVRPSRFWMCKPANPGCHFSDFFVDAATNKAMDSGLVQQLFPTLPAGVTPLGGAVPVAVSNLDTAVFGRASNGTLRQAYLPSTATQWTDFTLNINPTLAVASAPQAFNRSATDSSVWYACGAGTAFCEVRAFLPSNSQYMGSIPNGTASFGAGAFANGTRPTALAALSGDGSRWVFAVVDNTGGGRTLWAKRDHNALNAAAPDYSQAGDTFTLDSGMSGSVRFSTPMAYTNSAGQPAVVYLRSTGGGTMRVCERVFNGSSWTSGSAEIHDTGLSYPTSVTTEPVPSVARLPGMPARNSILFRLPLAPAPGYQDTVELRQQADGSYVKTMLPSGLDDSNVYIATPSDNRIKRVNEDTGSQDTLLSLWNGVTSFTSDRVGLGYLADGSGLWEANLQDGLRRPLATGVSWTGAKLAYGYDSTNGEPRLWAIQGGTLYKLNLGTQQRTALTSGTCPAWSNVSGITFLDHNGNANAEHLFVVNAATLYRVNSNTGACTQAGVTGDWPFSNAMTGDEASNKLYIESGLSATGSHRVFKVNPSTGVPEAWTNIISPTTAMAPLNGSIYMVKASMLYRLSPTTMHPTAVTSAVWGGTIFMATRTWQTGLGGCDQSTSGGCFAPQ